ncbi:MAG TPA: 50S ribosomal protein L17 [Polyangia bacterium]|nr:50S ribosomal protein L17 [Polyangia bacterium]
MRHRKAGVHLSRTSAHRKALFSNLIAALLTNERIRTTDAKAKETRRLAERTITWARRVGDVLTKKVDRRSTEESARVVHAVRMARRVVRDRGAVLKLFDEIAPRFAGRRGGYTRIVKLGQRPGDAAPMSLLELLPDENAPAPVESDKGGKAGKAGSKAAEGEGAKGAPKAAAAKKKGAAKAQGADGEAAEAPKKAAKKPAKPAKKDE